MDLFYATNNTSKIFTMKRRLEGSNLNILSPSDRSLKIEVVENGTTPIDNALKKARTYYSKVHMPVIAADSGLSIDGIAKEDQPGLYVRRVNGHTLTDDEMIEHYSTLAGKYGGTMTARYVTGLALIIDGMEDTIEINDDDFLLTAIPNINRSHRGNPLDIITIEPLTGKYYNELTDPEFRNLAWSFDRTCLKFLKKHFPNMYESL